MQIDHKIVRSALIRRDKEDRYIHHYNNVCTKCIHHNKIEHIFVSDNYGLHIRIIFEGMPGYVTSYGISHEDYYREEQIRENKLKRILNV